MPAFPNPRRPALMLAMAGLMTATLPQAALAQRGWGGGWGQTGWGGPGWDGSGWNTPASTRGSDPREGRVTSDHFVGDGALAALGHGAIAVITAPGSGAEPREQATYEAAIVDQLAKAGYDTVTPDPKGGQVVEVALVHDMLQPAEEKHSPLSGSMSAGVSNRGSMMGMSLNYDATKPRGALISTHIEIRIRDRVSGAALWESRADIATREGDSHWNDTLIATRLAAALFAEFPRPALTPAAHG